MNKVRENTNLTDKNGMGDSQVLRHFNDAQKTIQSLIYQAELEPDLFVLTTLITVAAGEVTADLPTDVFKDNAVLYVTPYGRNKKLSRIQSYERGFREGYFLENNEIGFSNGLLSRYTQFNVKYFRRIPVLDLRRGKLSVVGASSLTITGQSTTLDLTTLADYFTVVDKDGTIIQAGLPLTAYNAGTGVITTSGVDTAIVTTAHYIVLGKRASSHSELPDECEPFLLHFVQKMMRSKNVSKETGNQAVFSQEQQDILKGLFSGNSADPIYPPMTDNEWP